MHVSDTARTLTCRHLLSAGLLLVMSINSSPVKKGGEEYGYHRVINTHSTPPPLPLGSWSLHTRKQPNVTWASPCNQDSPEEDGEATGAKVHQVFTSLNTILSAATVNNKYKQSHEGHPVQTRLTVGFWLPLMWVLPGLGGKRGREWGDEEQTRK